VAQPTYVAPVVATAAPVAAVAAPVAPPCSVSATMVDGVAYYHCSGVWYTAGYGGSGVNYVAVAAPAGY
jgi:hypothetical protein